MGDQSAWIKRRHGTPTWVWWTANKDAAWALYELRSDPAWDVVGLISAISRFDGRCAGRGLRRELLEEQAEAAGLPLLVVECAARGGSFSVCDSDLELAFRTFVAAEQRPLPLATSFPDSRIARPYYWRAPA